MADHAENMAAYRRYLRGLVAGKATERDNAFASALLAIHDDDPEALAHEEIVSILSRSRLQDTRRRIT